MFSPLLNIISLQTKINTATELDDLYFGNPAPEPWNSFVHSKHRSLFHLQGLLLLLLLLLSHFSHVQLLCDPIDGSPSGSLVPGILQARILEWVAISFSNAWKWKVKVKSLSRVWLLTIPWTAAYQAPPSMGFSRQEYWSGLPLPFLAGPPTCSHLLWEYSNLLNANSNSPFDVSLIIR